MKITKSQLQKIIKEELNEVTQGEMEFQPFEDARQVYLQEPNDDTKHELGLMINKLVEPLMAEMGLFWEAEAYYNVGKIVFNNNKVEVTIDPRGAMGRYDVNISAQVSAMDTDPAFKPIEIAIPSMKGVVQFVNDKVFSSSGMAGEPEAQTELPFGEGVKRLKESSSRFEVELFMKDKASGLFRDGLSPKAVEMELVEFFMDKIDGPEHPIAEYEWFLKELANNPADYLDDDSSDQGVKQSGALHFKNARRTSEPQRAYRMEHKVRITKSQLQQVVREELLKEVEIGRGPSDRMEDYESDYRDPPSPVDPLLAAAEAAYHELGDWLGHVDADENTGRVLDQLAAAINGAGGNV